MDAAAQEIDWELGYTEADPAPDPVPPLVIEVNVERAVEHWRQLRSPFGVIGIGGESEPIVTARNSWYRHHLKLAPLKVHQGVADGALAETMEAIADALEPFASEIEGLQVYPYLNSNPTPPSLDIYPGARSRPGPGSGSGTARCSSPSGPVSRTADQEAANQLLFRLLDPNDAACVEAAMADTAPSSRKACRSSANTSRTPPATAGCSGCEWRVSCFL